MDDIEDEDFILYVLLGLAVAYFLYKNNVFGAPAISAGTALPALPAPNAATSGASAPVAAATSTAAAQGPAGTSNELVDFGIDAATGW
jgi:hypothetical protein